MAHYHTLRLYRSGTLHCLVGLTAASLIPATALGQQCSQASCADAVRTGAAAHDRFGMAVAGAGRVNQNQKEDSLIGAYQHDASAANSGRAYTFRDSNLTPWQTISVGGAGDGFGRAVAGLPDVNNDGRDDLVIGAPFNNDGGPDAGRVYVVSGKTKQVLWTAQGEHAGDRFGLAVAPAGDVDDDGVDDVIVGAPGNDQGGSAAGRAYILSGNNGHHLWTVTGTEPGEQFGSAVAGIGDLNDDGFADFAVGAPGHDLNGGNGGRVYLYSGRDAFLFQALDAEFGGERLGTSLAAREYVDGGTVYTILIVGIPLDDQGGNNAGHFHIYVSNHDEPACPGWFCEIYIVNGDAPGDHLGQAVAMGEAVGNGIPDFLVGAPLGDDAGKNAGKVYLYSLNSINTECCGSPDVVRVITGEAPGDRFGTAVALADVNNDGRDDLIVGAPYNDAGGKDAGRVYLFLSAP